MTHPMEPSGSGFLSEHVSAQSVWHWRLEDSAGAEVSGVSLDGQRFSSQGDAETWVGEWWRQLREEGVDAVTLLEGDRVVYGPMSLHA